MPHLHGETCTPPRLRIGPNHQPPWTHLDEPSGRSLEHRDRGSTWTCECGATWVLRESIEASHEFMHTHRVYWESQDTR